MTLFKDEPKDDYTYDVIKGKNNELVIIIRLTNLYSVNYNLIIIFLNKIFNNL